MAVSINLMVVVRMVGQIDHNLADHLVMMTVKQMAYYLVAMSAVKMEL